MSHREETPCRVSLLADRGVLRVTGADAKTFLQGLLTNDMGKTESGNAIHAGLLSPQGKILFDFFVVPAGGGYVIDAPKDTLGELAKRLSFYRLRADVAIELRAELGQALDDARAALLPVDPLGQLAGNGGRDVLIYIPPGADDAAAFRLVFHFHGTHSEHVERRAPGVAKEVWVGWDRLTQTLEGAAALQAAVADNVALVYPFSAGKRMEPEWQGWSNKAYDRMWMRPAPPKFTDDFAALHREVTAVLTGELGVHPLPGRLDLVLDLARRLTLANPKLDDPLREGRGVVLIDEIDLHLHPRWQRTIVDKLTRTFPNCQFIATTHSPQIVGEISPDNIILIENGKATRPDQSLGMDTNWILRHLMGVSERDEETKRKLENIEALIEDEQYDAATQKIDDLRRRLGDFPELVGLQTRIDMIQFLSDAEDE